MNLPGFSVIFGSSRFFDYFPFILRCMNSGCQDNGGITACGMIWNLVKLTNKVCNGQMSGSLSAGGQLEDLGPET
jgi:hypothetical protein